VDIDTLLKEVGYEKLCRVESLALADVPMDLIAQDTGLSLETVELVLCTARSRSLSRRSRLLSPGRGAPVQWVMHRQYRGTTSS
jgi:hypothetical protein